jgi:NAD(P)-dependent dehydrogenase (short-subunit alcohol dehydrogenase family)
MAPLDGQIALVAGATRGAGRGIARGLGEAGAFVYCTGRSVRGNPSAYGRPETIEETAEMVTGAGGKAVALRVDHTRESEVIDLLDRIKRDHARIDMVVNCIAGEDPMMSQWGSFWDADLGNGEAIFRQAILSHVITSKHAARHMIASRRGLIVEVTEGDTLLAGGNPLTQTVKLALKAIALNLAGELHEYGVTSISITPGFLRSEAMLEHHGVTEANWRDGGKKDPNFLASESPLFIGRAVAALAADPNVFARTGQLTSSWEIGREYGLTDYDGRRPDWGRHAIDFSVLPPELLELFRTMTRLQLQFLETMVPRTSEFLDKMDRSPA